jgi:exonuclease I
MTFSSVTPLVLLIRSIDEETTRKIIYRNVIDKHQLNNLQANAAWQHP